MNKKIILVIVFILILAGSFFYFFSTQTKNLSGLYKGTITIGLFYFPRYIGLFTAKQINDFTNRLTKQITLI